jgi:hypothetical protein
MSRTGNMSEKEFYYDQELYEKLQCVTKPTVYALDMGLGKTQSMYKYLWDFHRKKALIIVNSIRQLNELKEWLGDKVSIWHSDLKDINFQQIKNDYPLGITKIKFFQLLLHDELEYLNQFEEYYYDEFSGLSPIAATELVNDLSAIIQKIQYSGSNLDFVFDVSDLFKQLIVELNNNQKYKENIVYQMKISNAMRGEAADLLDQYIKIRNDPEKTNIILDTSILVLLKALISEEIFISRFVVKKKSKYALVVKTDTLKRFIQQKHFVVFDATAELNRKDYDYIGIQIDKQFSKNKFDYANLTIVNTYVSNVSEYSIRNGSKPALDKIVQSVPDTERKYYTFAPKKAMEPLISTFGYDPKKLYYFFSGEDVGSNTFKDDRNLVVIAMQTYPRILRIVYNNVVYGYSLDKANRNEYDLAEWYMITRDLVQLIGRTAVRKHLEEPVTVYLKQVDRNCVQLMKEQHFKNCKVIENGIHSKSRGKTEISLDLIRHRLIGSDRDVVYIDDILNDQYETKDAIRAFFSRQKRKICDLIDINGWVLIKDRGKNPYFLRKENSVTTDKSNILYRLSQNDENVCSDQSDPFMVKEDSTIYDA